MTEPSRVFFVNRFYWPDEPATAQLLTDLAEALAATGLAITVITSSPREPKCPMVEMRNGVHILRVQGSRWGRRSLVGRCADFVSFSVGALRLLSARARPGDTVVVMTDPPLLGILAARLAHRRGARLIHWIQDVYPEIATAVSGSKLPLLFRGARNRAWRRADRCTVLGTDMARFIASTGVAKEKIVVCPNWAPAGLAPAAELPVSELRAQWNLDGKFVVGYSGNLGRVHDLEPALEVATALRDEPDIAFVFIGDGAQKLALQTIVDDRRLTNVFFQPSQPRERLAQTLSLPDLHLVTLRAGCEPLVFPSKLYGIAAVGRPVLFIGPLQSEFALLVQSNGFGLAVSREDPAAAADAICRLRSDAGQQAVLRQAAIRFWETNGQLNHAMAIWSSLLQSGKPLASPTASTPSSGK
jgi:glycosyltransferase involved in cell wall biosynthesis